MVRARSDSDCYRRVLRRCDYFIGWSGVAVRAACRMGLDGSARHQRGPPVGVDTATFHPADADGEASPARRDRTSRGHGSVSCRVRRTGSSRRRASATGGCTGQSAVKGPSVFGSLCSATARCADSSRRRGARALALDSISRRDQAGVARFMRGLDALVLPSRSTSLGEEQFGLVLAEAMACDLPVIGSSCGAIPEVVGAAGRIFPEGDIPALAAALAGIAHDQRAGAAASAHSRQRAASMYSSAAIAASIMGTIQRASVRAQS